MKIKNFCSLNEQSTGWEKVFEKHTFDKGFVSGIYFIIAQK